MRSLEHFQLFSGCLVFSLVIPTHPRNKGANWKSEEQALDRF
jgi:hypothetical protein